MESDNKPSHKKQPAVNKPIEQLKQDLAYVANTEQGLNVLRYLVDLCGYHKGSISVSRASGEINPLVTIHDEAIRGIWLHLRQLMPHNRLVMIELPEPKKVEQKEQEISSNGS